MKKRNLGSLMVISFLLSGCGVQAITEAEAYEYMQNIRQMQKEEGFVFPHQFTVEMFKKNLVENTLEHSSIVLDEVNKYCYSFKSVENVSSSDSSYAEKWVYVKDNQCIIVSNENGVPSYQILTGDLDTLWVTYSSEIRNEAKERIKGNAYLVSTFYHNDPQIFEDRTLFYDDNPKIRCQTTGAGSLMISLSRFVVDSLDKETKQAIGKVTYQIHFADYLLQECVLKGHYEKENVKQMIEEKTKIMKKAKIDYPTSSNLSFQTECKKI